MGGERKRLEQGEGEHIKYALLWTVEGRRLREGSHRASERREGGREREREREKERERASQPAPSSSSLPLL